jgi:WD40 repeat protein
MIFQKFCVSLSSQFVVWVLTSQNFGSIVNGVAFHPTKNVLASCSADRTIKLWNMYTGAVLSTLKGKKPIRCLAFSRNGRTLVSGDGWIPNGRDYSIRLYHVEAGTQIR